MQTRLLSISGFLLMTMILIIIANGVWPQIPRLPGTIAAWSAGLILLSTLSVGQRVQVGLIAGTGILLMVVGHLNDAQVSLVNALDANSRLLTMIAAVGFLRLVAIPASRVDQLNTRGPTAYFQTLLAVSVLGSVINISAPLLIADRIQVRGTLTRLASQSITRVFSGCSAWSPFFGGMATVITYVDEARLSVLMLAGLPFALIGLLLVLAEAHWRYQEQMSDFSGYPMSLMSLRVPLILAASVFCIYQLLPGVSILVVIALAALAVTITILCLRIGVRSAWVQITEHVTTTLSRMGSELALFLAAGLLAAGLAALVNLGWLSLSFAHFDAATASALLGGMLILSAIGIHPVILIAGLTPLLMELKPPPDLLALTYLIAWSIGTNASPLSGTHLIFQGRYAIPSWQAAMWNWPFAIVMYVIGVGLLYSLTLVPGIADAGS